jgi:hypothetical protein
VKPRNRSRINPLVVREDQVPDLLQIGRNKWLEIKASPLGLATLDVVKLGANSVGYTMASLEKLVAKLPRVDRPKPKETAETARPWPEGHRVERVKAKA